MIFKSRTYNLLSRLIKILPRERKYAILFTTIPLAALNGICDVIILGLVSWTIILNIINLGIKEISAEKSRISNF